MHSPSLSPLFNQAGGLRQQVVPALLRRLGLRQPAHGGERGHPAAGAQGVLHRGQGARCGGGGGREADGAHQHPGRAHQVGGVAVGGVVVVWIVRATQAHVSIEGATTIHMSCVRASVRELRHYARKLTLTFSARPRRTTRTADLVVAHSRLGSPSAGVAAPHLQLVGQSKSIGMVRGDSARRRTKAASPSPPPRGRQDIVRSSGPSRGGLSSPEQGALQG